jgi:transcriptional regulator with XRE-family HTH domain
VIFFHYLFKKNIKAMKIKQLRENLGLTQQQMADSIGIERTLYNKIEAGKNKLTVEQIKKVIKIHNVNSDWILFAEGGMIGDNNVEDFSEKYKNNTTPKNESADKSAEFNADKSAEWLQLSTKKTNTDINFSGEDALQLLKNEGFIGKKVYVSPEPAMASYPANYITEQEASLEHFYMPFLSGSGLYACFKVQGRSMEEYILTGSWVVCRLLEENWQIRSGNIHLIATQSEGLLLKRVRQEPKIKEKGIVCYSDNPQYLPFIIPNEEIIRIWSVELFLQREFPFTSQRAEDNLEVFLDNL